MFDLAAHFAGHLTLRSSGRPMPRRTTPPWLPLFCVVALLASACGSPPVELRKKEDLGAFPLPGTIAVGRDGTVGSRVGARLLWTFGDTFLTEKTEDDASHVRSATAGWSAPAAPLALEAPLTDAGIPLQFIPYTAEELEANTRDALNGWALWPVAQLEANGTEALILFDRIQRIEGSGFESRGVATARAGEDETIARRGGDLFLPPERSYGAGGFGVHEGQVYLFACETSGFLEQGCRVARAQVARAAERGAYVFFDGKGWSPDEASAAIVVKGVGGGLSVHFNAHLGRFLAVTSGLLSNRIVLLTAERIEGPYEKSQEFEPDEVHHFAAPEHHNYLAREQPVLSSADGRDVVVSYSRPMGNFRGEVRLLRLSLD